MATMAWIAMRYDLEEDFFVSENVKAFPPFTLFALLETKYVIQTHVAALTVQGWPQRRVRRITVGFNKKRVVARIPWDVFNSGFKRKVQIPWQALTIADGENTHEINAELRRARDRPSSLFGQCLDTAIENASDKFKCDKDLYNRLSWLKGQSAFTDSLSLWELRNCLKYMDQCQDTDIFDLGQDATAHPHIGHNSLLPTIIRNTHMLFSPSIWRWLLPSELLLAQGFPVTLRSKVNDEACCFNCPRIFPRRHKEMVHQAGNSMNTHMIGLPILWSMICTSKLQTWSDCDSSEDSEKSKNVKQPCTAACARTPARKLGDTASLFFRTACGQQRAKLARLTDHVESSCSSSPGASSATIFFRLAAGEQ